MTIVANMRLETCRVRWRRGLGASQVCLGPVLAALGPLFGSFWTLPDVSWAPRARFLNTLGRIWPLMGASGLDFGGSLVPPGWVLESSSGSFRHGFWPCLLHVATASIKCMNCCRKSVSAFPEAFVFPLRRGGTCAVRTSAASRRDAERAGYTVQVA